MKTNTVLSTFLAIVYSFLAGPSSHATALIFDITGISNGQPIDQAYGDNVTATNMGDFTYGSDQGFTPDITLAYGSGAPQLWVDSFGDLTNVLESGADGTLLILTFTAASGFDVRLHSFDIAAWAPGFGSDPTINSVTVFDSNNVSLFSQSNVTVSETAHTSFTFPTPLVSTVLRVEINALNLDSDDIGIDNVIFSQRSASQICNKTIAMMVNGSSTAEAGLYTIHGDGSKLTKLLSVPASPHGGGAPRWSPDGTQIVFDAELDGYDEIYVINQDGTGLEQLTFDSATDRDPAWSPDGTRIVFSSNRGGLSQQDLFVMNADGSNIANLTNSSASNEYAPDWSPNGSQIVFDRYATGKLSDLWIMNADGSGQTNLTPHTKRYADGSGRWLADGTKLTFTSTRMGNGDVFVMNPDGTGVTDLTNNPASDYGATSWSHRDGSLEIAFTSRRSGFSGVYTINGDRTNQKAIFRSNTLDNLYLDARR